MSDQDQAMNVESTQDETIQATNMAQLTFAIGSWFTDCHAAARQLLEVPEGMQIEVQTSVDGPIETINLTGEAHKAFIAGAIGAINMFSELPFRVEDDAEPKSDESASSQ